MLAACPRRFSALTREPAFCWHRVCATYEAAAGPNLKSPPVVYQKTPAAAECAVFEPDIIVLGPFGKHDAMSPIGWGKEAQKNGGYDRPAPFTAEEWRSDLGAMAAALTASGARLLLTLPVPFPSGCTEHAVATVCLPATQQLAADLDVPMVDLFTPFAGKGDSFPDADHLDNPATDVMTAAVAEQVRALAESAKL